MLNTSEGRQYLEHHLYVTDDYKDNLFVNIVNVYKEKNVA